MKTMRDVIRRAGFLATLTMLGSISCSREFDLLGPEAPSAPDGFLTIRTEKESYTLSEVFVAGFIRASLVNRTDRLFHSTLGDGFNAAVEQPDLYVAEGSHAFLERWTVPHGWRSVPRGLLIEGVRTIEIHPKGSYGLIAFYGHQVWTIGRYRLRVEIFDDAEIRPGDVAHQEYSSTFTIR
jgi:hypothetical protein